MTQAVNTFQSYIDSLFQQIFVGTNADELAKRDAEIRERELEEVKQERINAFKNTGIGEAMFDCSFSTFEAETEKQKIVVDKAKKFCESVKKGEVKNFVICGAVGTGKTHISVAIIRHIIQQAKGYICEFPVYFTAQYATSADINDRLISAQSFSSKERRVDIIEQYRTCDVLVIDEVGRMPSKNEEDMLFQIIDSRYQNNKSTVLCTNYNSDELKQAIGKAAVSRLGADGRLIFVNTDGIPDMRNRSVNK